MQIQTTKVFAGMMLSMLASAASLYPALAQQSDDAIASGASELKTAPFLISQATQAGELAGSIVSLDGETAEFRQPNGQTRRIRISQQDIDRLKLKAGGRIAIRVDAQGRATAVRTIEPIRGLW